MLLSGVGNAYNPVTVTGSVGRGLTYGYGPYTSTSGPSGSLAIGGNSYPAGNGSGGGVDLYDFMDDNFDHTGLNFVGGSQLSVGTYAGSGPGNITFAGGVGAGSMGSTFKATQKGKYAHTTTAVSLGGTGPDLPTTTHMWDLDPTYTDVWGDPLPRTTHDWTPNPYNVATWFSQGGESAMVAILTKMGAASANINTKITPVPALAAHTDWWGHHWRGGNRIGTDPATSVYNKWNQSWTAPNLFAAGEVTNTTGDAIPSGTHAAGPQVQVASEGIQKYLSSPGLLS
jgi:gluconate 2-dehydrogenase alpha chain